MLRQAWKNVSAKAATPTIFSTRSRKIVWVSLSSRLCDTDEVFIIVSFAAGEYRKQFAAAHHRVRERACHNAARASKPARAARFFRPAISEAVLQASPNPPGCARRPRRPPRLREEVLCRDKRAAVCRMSLAWRPPWRRACALQCLWRRTEERPPPAAS